MSGVFPRRCFGPHPPGAPSIRGFIADGWAVARSATTAAKLTPCRKGLPDRSPKVTVIAIAIATEGDQHIRQLVEHVLEIPGAPELLLPILEVVPLQLLAYTSPSAAAATSTNQEISPRV